MDEEGPEDEGVVEFGSDPDIIELGPGQVTDQGKFRRILRLILDNATPEDRDFAYEHPGLSARRRDDGMLEVLASDGRVLGAFDPGLLQPDP